MAMHTSNKAAGRTRGVLEKSDIVVMKLPKTAFGLKPRSLGGLSAEAL
jgi:hypothetical protein